MSHKSGLGCRRLASAGSSLSASRSRLGADRAPPIERQPQCQLGLASAATWCRSPGSAAAGWPRPDRASAPAAAASARTRRRRSSASRSASSASLGRDLVPIAGLRCRRLGSAGSSLSASRSRLGADPAPPIERQPQCQLGLARPRPGADRRAPLPAAGLGRIEPQRQPQPPRSGSGAADRAPAAVPARPRLGRDLVPIAWLRCRRLASAGSSLSASRSRLGADRAPPIERQPQ
jgi:hypothetical protein